MLQATEIPKKDSIIEMKLQEWNTNSPSELSLDEAIRIFVDGMEYQARSHARAIEETFNRNLENVLEKAHVWYTKLKSEDVPVMAMYARPDSIYTFSLLMAVNTEYFVSDNMLNVYKKSRAYFQNLIPNVQINYSYMPAKNRGSINKSTIISDGYFFEHKTR